MSTAGEYLYHGCIFRYLQSWLFELNKTKHVAVGKVHHLSCVLLTLLTGTNRFMPPEKTLSVWNILSRVIHLRGCQWKKKAKVGTVGDLYLFTYMRIYPGSHWHPVEAYYPNISSKLILNSQNPSPLPLNSQDTSLHPTSFWFPPKTGDPSSLPLEAPRSWPSSRYWKFDSRRNKSCSPRLTVTIRQSCHGMAVWMTHKTWWEKLF